ncbi:MAG: FxsA family protein [Acidimicrobiia bacterium]|nr:FxsA family protein [Acidimicrobiia bacterium]
MGLFFLAFLVIPVAEIALFITIGQRIGVAYTLSLIVITAIIGAYLVARQGRGVWARAQGQLAAGSFPGPELAHGAMVIFGGALLLTPGFLTDAVGFSLMIPLVREMLRRWGTKRFSSQVDIIDL